MIRMRHFFPSIYIDDDVQEIACIAKDCEPVVHITRCPFVKMLALERSRSAYEECSLHKAE
jgi:hypothetical protein